MSGEETDTVRDSGGELEQPRLLGLEEAGILIEILVLSKSQSLPSRHLVSLKVFYWSTFKTNA